MIAWRSTRATVAIPSYTEQFELAATHHDALRNATPTDLLARGIIHGYYRMYWGQ
ncbi:MAG TPA: hypothetical protein VL127_17935 [Bryobacteraceae bacterium]|nr:hypothetical protein [Bryobacteraceae bacterium]